MPDIDINKEDVRTALLLLQKDIKELIDDFKDFKAEDKEWKENYKKDKEKEDERLKNLEEFMVKKITENGYLREQDKELIEKCSARFERYDEMYHWLENYKKFFWLVLSVFITGIVTNFLSFFDIIFKK